MHESDAYKRGKWEASTDAQLSRHEERLNTSDEERKELQVLVNQLKDSLELFNAAQKQREAITAALSESVDRQTETQRANRTLWISLTSVIVTAISALTAVIALVH